MNGSSLTTPDEWLSINQEQAEEIFANGGQWPFKNITTNQLYALSDILTVAKNLQLPVRILAPVLTGFGVVFTALLIGTLWKQAVIARNSFFFAMLMIAITDMLFNIFNYHVLLYRLWNATGYSNYAAMWVIAVIRGLQFVMSLASDVLTLFLTLERYLAISRVLIYQRIPERVKTRIWKVAIVFAFLISFTRIHYTLIIDVEKSGSAYVYTESSIADTQFVVGLSLFSDAILPIILAIVVPILSTNLRMAVVKREKVKVRRLAKNSSRVAPQEMKSEGKAQGAQEGNGSLSVGYDMAARSENASSVVILTLSLDAFLIFNNLGYCLYFAAEMRVTRSRITFNSSYDEFLSYCYAQNFEVIAALVSLIVECAARSVNFPIYMALSKTMRIEFKEFLKKVIRTRPGNH